MALTSWIGNGADRREVEAFSSKFRVAQNEKGRRFLEMKMRIGNAEWGVDLVMHYPVADDASEDGLVERAEKILGPKLDEFYNEFCHCASLLLCDFAAEDDAMWKRLVRESVREIG